jgi:hypothetical protein
MISSSSGQSQVFWQEQGVAPAFFRDRSEYFHAHHDGRPHQYAVEFSPANPVLAVRIDPSGAPGKMTLSNIKLTDDQGRVAHQWGF